MTELKKHCLRINEIIIETAKLMFQLLILLNDDYNIDVYHSNNTDLMLNDE